MFGSPTSGELGLDEPEEILEYRIQRVLGKGVYARVLHGLSPTGENVALKVQEVSAQKLQKWGFPVIESWIISNARHPNIIRAQEVHHFWGDPLIIVSVLEYGEETLEDWCRRPHSLASRLRVIHQILCGLEFLHESKIIHADLKPANIIMVDGIAKISDFGLSKRAVGQELDPSVQTLNWRAPEILASPNPHYTTKIDMWSMGVVIYQVLFGTPLFPNTDEFRLQQSQLWIQSLLQVTTFPPEWEEYSPYLTELLVNCFRIDPVQRWTASQARQSLLFTFLPWVGGSWVPSRGSSPPDPEVTKWMYLTARGCKIDPSIFALALDLFERYTFLHPLKVDRILLYCMACLYLAIQLSDWNVALDHFLDGEGISPLQLTLTMTEICHKLDFNIYPDGLGVQCREKVAAILGAIHHNQATPRQVELFRLRKFRTLCSEF